MNAETVAESASGDRAGFAPGVVNQFFDEAARAVGALAAEVARITALFRHDDVKAANQALGLLPLELRNFIVTITVVETQLGVSSEALTVDGLTPPAQITRLGEWLQVLVNAQAQDDPLTIADILEYDLEPFLQVWAGILMRQVAG